MKNCWLFLKYFSCLWWIQTLENFLAAIHHKFSMKGSKYINWMTGTVFICVLIQTDFLCEYVRDTAFLFNIWNNIFIERRFFKLNFFCISNYRLYDNGWKKGNSYDYHIQLWFFCSLKQRGPHHLNLHIYSDLINKPEGWKINNRGR